MTVCVALGLTGIIGISICVAAVVVVIVAIVAVRAFRFRKAYAEAQQLVGADVAVKTDK